MRHRWIAVITLGFLAGCGQSVPEAKQQAYERWYRLRADMLCNVAEEHLKVGVLDKAEGKAREALALDTEFMPAHKLLGQICIEQGRYTQAVTHLKKACELDPQAAEAHYLLAVAQEKSDRLEEALTGYQYAYHLDDSNLDPVVAASEVLVAMGRVPEAQVYLHRHMPRTDNNPHAFELAGRLAMMTAQYDKAIQFFAQACDLEPKNGLYVEKLARAQFSAGQYAEAKETLDGLATCKDRRPSLWVYLMLAEACLALDHPDEARAAFQSASRLDGSSPAAWVGLAKAELALGRADRVVSPAERALVLDKDNREASMLLGCALLTEKRAEEALRHLITATERYPRDATLWCLRGRAHAGTGDSAEAVRCYARAVRLDPDCRVARELLEAPVKMEVSRRH